VHDNDVVTDDEKELRRVHCFMHEARKTTGIVISDGDVARLAMAFRNAMCADGAGMIWMPREESVTR
jgi:hypothetical protein